MKTKFNISTDAQLELLEKALANSVRLCVVAPTVNVHVGEEKFKLQSG